MSRSHPPALAVWLLREVGPAVADEALLGDLFEEYERHGSVGWFWRQAVAAILLGAWRDLVRHWPLVAGAIVIGWIILVLPILFLFASLWLSRLGLIFLLIPNLGRTPQLAVAVIAGWVVARLFADLRAAAVLTLAASVVCLGVVVIEELLRSGADADALVFFYMAAVMWAALLYATCIVIGGFVGRRGGGVFRFSVELALRQRVDRAMNVLRPMRDL